jgi:hypothetical protein
MTDGILCNFQSFFCLTVQCGNHILQFRAVDCKSLDYFLILSLSVHIFSSVLFWFHMHIITYMIYDSLLHTHTSVHSNVFTNRC